VFGVQFEIPEFPFLNSGGIMLALNEAHAKLATRVVAVTKIIFDYTDLTATHEALTSRSVEFLNTTRNVSQGQKAANSKNQDRHLLAISCPHRTEPNRTDSPSHN
jgi:hypothetical protein